MDSECAKSFSQGSQKKFKHSNKTETQLTIEESKEPKQKQKKTKKVKEVVSQEASAAESPFVCQACNKRFLTKNKKKQHMKTEEHKARYAIFEAISEKQKYSASLMAHYYINRRIKRVHITGFTNDDYPCVWPVPAGRITCSRYNYCQVDEERILLAESDYRSAACKMLSIFNIGQEMKMQPLSSYPGEKRNFFTMCKVSNRTVFLIGGVCLATEINDNGIWPTLRYNVDNDEWHEFAAPVVPRFNCSSCFVNGYIYLFCGERNNCSGFMNSIEKLRINEQSQDQEEWQLIPDVNFPARFTVRSRPLVCQINHDEIVILGGYFRDIERKKSYDVVLQDVFLFNTQSNKLEEVKFDHTIIFNSKFSGDDGICQTKPNQFVILQSTKDDHHLQLNCTVVKSDDLTFEQTYLKITSHGTSSGSGRESNKLLFDVK